MPGAQPRLDESGDYRPVRAHAVGPVTELTRHEHRGAFAQLFNVPPADFAGHLDVVKRVGPQQPRVFGMGHWEFNFQEGERIASRPLVLYGVGDQRSRDDRVVDAGRDRLGKERPVAGLLAMSSSPARRYFTSLRT